MQPRIGKEDAHACATRARQDDRFKRLKPRTKDVLLIGVDEFMGASGYFWPTLRKWADAAGVSPATIKRALVELCEAELVTREPFLRPPGAGDHGGMQGATTYRLAPEFLVPQGGSFLNGPQGGSDVSHQNKGLKQNLTPLGGNEDHLVGEGPKPEGLNSAPHDLEDDLKTAAAESSSDDDDDPLSGPVPDGWWEELVGCAA